jgi:hypothetical protein
MITEEELDAQLLQLRGGVAGLEAEAARLGSPNTAAEARPAPGRRTVP